jgi:hypothetical protein
VDACRRFPAVLSSRRSILGLPLVVSMSAPLMAASQPAPSPPPAATECQVTDIMPSFWTFWNEAKSMDVPHRVARFKSLVITPHPELYTREALGLPESMTIDQLLASSLKTIDSLIPAMQAIQAPLRSQLRDAPARFTRVFPDYACSMPIYIMPSLGAFDGGTRPIRGRLALLFGVDVLAQVDGPTGLPSIVDHELFHVYHAHVLGSDTTKPLDDGDEPIYQSLWEEGLATYASHVLDPDVPMHLILGSPSDLAERAHPMLPALTHRLVVAFDSVSSTTYAFFFLGPMRTSGAPARSGYYIGYLAVQDLARRRSLSELAHLSFRQVHDDLLAAVARLGKPAGS